MSAYDPKRTYRFGIYCLSHTLRESSNKRSAFAIRPRVSVMLSRVLRIISQISFSTFMDAERYRLKCSIASVMAGSIACSLLRREHKYPLSATSAWSRAAAGDANTLRLCSLVRKPVIPRYQCCPSNQMHDVAHGAAVTASGNWNNMSKDTLYGLGRTSSA